VLRADRHPDRGRVVLVVAEVELVQRVLAAVPANVVEHPGQQPGVHQVAGDLDGLGDLHGCPPKRVMSSDCPTIRTLTQTTAPSSPPSPGGSRSFIRKTSVR